MLMRNEVRAFVALGSLPGEGASEEAIRLFQEGLAAIKAPVSDAEAAELINSFGPDDCYGLAWTLLHLIETAPSGCPLTSPPDPSENEWRRRLWERGRRGSSVLH